ncbi:isocitrate lyase/phosphoenolpyruvate mutase family protein [Pseudovibrio exalbescens]|uniref:isocitrate lyase/PEP mutase family protein n=1 Tax=Pseudovibrio exalbescens TaxID=197461 RepID=UPI00236694F0|nr:isocitrate lyase/phosphoenolpyruvate mutase family protein [Pseudovibrio exalbescens]MDD7910963.1 isocitrate lyase/phosphoenolpyruvate mutase family protein [Pseudovibrio exalbescens]
MSQAEKASRFADLHQKGNPVVLYNIWDAGGAQALAKAGAPAVATGSWSMAAAHGYGDGEALPLDFFLNIVERICASVDVPVTVDFEGGYATEPAEVAQNARKMIRAGAIGINFEDRIVKGEGLHSIEAQAARIKAIKAAAADEGVPLFLNARTDLFLGTDPATHESSLAEAREREAAYAEAGADCFFIPGLTETALISRVVDAATLPVNVMMIGDLTSVKDVAALGVSRASFGPAPFIQFLADFKKAYAGVVS